MHSSQVVNGVHKISKDNVLDSATVKLMKTQDMNYINLSKSIDDKKIEKLKTSLHFLDKMPSNKHTIFSVNLSGDTTTATKVTSTTSLSSSERKKILSIKDKSYKELDQRTARVAKLNKALLSLNEQRNLIGSKGSKRKIVTKKAEGGNEIVSFKWKRQRTR
jgi:U3 small nucleolar RNA-associated protein 11